MSKNTVSDSRNNEIDLPFDPTSIKRGKERIKSNINIDDIIHGFRVIDKKHIEESNFTAYQLVHLKTNAKHLHLESDDKNNVFTIVFKTIPTDDKGIPHILEHITLCGSEKFPVRDPFFNMMKRSLNTYMNAWTDADYTGYPFSSQNVKDYYNLMAIYLDAVFYPKLEYLDFLQEGHRLEFNKETGKLEHKGIVYNEMKGALSDPGDLYITELNRHLYPTITYKYNSGGDPKCIRDVTIDDLKEFKEKYYHPSNAYTITYGDIPLEHSLEFINRYFKDFDKVHVENEIQREIRFKEPKRITFYGPLSNLSDEDKQVKVSVSWLMNMSSDYYESFAMSILSMLLISGPNSPMYQALITPNIGSSYTPGSGYDSSGSEATFSIGLSDIAEEDIDKVENLIYETIQKAYNEGFNKERIESVIHQVEYSLRHVTTEYGLDLVSNSIPTFLHGERPIDAFVTNETIQKLRKDIESGPFFQNLIKKWFIDNNHRLTFIMIPDKDYAERESKEEENSIQKIIEREEFEEILKPKIIEDSKLLKERQEQIDDIEILPKIKLSEIDKQIEKVDTRKSDIDGIPITWNPQPTNGIVYFRCHIDIGDISEELLPYIPLFCTTLTRMGTQKKSYKELAQEIESKTGSFRAYSVVIGNNENINDYIVNLGLKSSCLLYNIDAMFDLWGEIINFVKFDDLDRLKTLIRKSLSTIQDSINDSGQIYARIYASQFLLPHHKVHEIWEGLTQFKFIRSLKKSNDLLDIVQKLRQIANIVLNKKRIKIAINAEEKNFDQIKQSLIKLIESFPSNNNYKKGVLPFKGPETSPEKNKMYIGLQTQVNFVTQVYKSAEYTHEDFSKLDVLTQLMTNNYLHREIREKGGAYGGGLVNTSETLAFYSYRDPHIHETIEAFRNSIDWVIKGNFTEENINEAKIQLFSSLDTPTPPSRKGLSEFFSGLTNEMRQERRDRIFKVNKQDLIDVCKKYFKVNENYTVVIGENQKKAIKENPEWLYHDV